MNNTEERKITVLNQEIKQTLNAVYNNPDMEKRADLKEILEKYIDKLNDNQKIDLILPLLYKRIAAEYLSNSKNFPKSLIELYYQIRVISSKYDGLEWSDMQAGLTWFE